MNQNQASEDQIWELAQAAGFDDYELLPMLTTFAAAVSQPAQEVECRVLERNQKRMVSSATDEQRARINSAYAAPPASQEPVCPRCDGAGTVTELSDNSPDAHEVDVACPHCNGSGALEDAYTGLVALLKRATENYHRALPYMVKVQNETAGLPPPALPASQEHAQQPAPAAVPEVSDEQMISAAFDSSGLSGIHWEGFEAGARAILALRTAGAVPEGYALIGVDALRSWGKLEEVRAACVYPITTAPPAPKDGREVMRNSDRYLWLRDVSVPPHNFYLSVPVEFDGVKYQPCEVDAAIDAAMSAAQAEREKEKKA